MSKTYTPKKWIAEGERLFGKSYENWKFKCPKCGNIATGQNFKDADAAPDDMWQNCIGRFVEGKGCDWAAYGLFDICKMHIIDGNKTIPVFEFADEEIDTKEKATPGAATPKGD